MVERLFQPKIISKISQKFPSAFVFKINPIPGFPDLMILYQERWAALECKQSATASFRPNQEYYLNLTNEMAFSRMICPENSEQVLEELYDYLAGT